MKLRESDDAEATAVKKKNLCMTFHEFLLGTSIQTILLVCDGTDGGSLSMQCRLLHHLLVVECLTSSIAVEEPPRRTCIKMYSIRLHFSPKK